MPTKNPDLKITDPAIFVIFGTTGDLAKKKLIPAIFDLYRKGVLPDRFRFLGVARRPLSEEEFKEYVRAAVLAANRRHQPRELAAFLRLVAYQKADFIAAEDYAAIAQKLHGIDKALKACTNKLFHLAVPPDSYATIVEHIARSGLNMVCRDEEEKWTRLLIEKPFGRDLATARQLDRQLAKLFKEEQIFRIDHYLGKETMQNILAFRFSNSLFEPIWNREYIERIEIKMLETEDVSHRINFYNGVGALRDVGQNHMLQMLAAVAMENPVTLDATIIRNNRTAIFKQLKRMPARDIAHYAVRGQYRGYQQEKENRKRSDTETYFQLKTFINNRRWKGVPFYLESGKALKEASTTAKVYFKQAKTCFECDIDDERPRNVLTFRIQPDEGITVCFWAKEPGLTMKMHERELAFDFHNGASDDPLPDAYEHLIYDAIRGDQTLFASTAEEVASWQYITPILEHWKNIPLQAYPKGSAGPKNKLS